MLGVIPGVLGAAGGAIASWVQRGHFDTLASSNRQLYKELQRELREYDARTGPYRDEAGTTPEDAVSIRFRTFVERCEKSSEDAQDLAERAISPRAG